MSFAPEDVAGMAVFDVSSVPQKMIHGHAQNEKWNDDKFNSLSDDMKSAIKKYSYRNREKTIALRSKDGTITPFKRGRSSKK